MAFPLKYMKVSGRLGALIGDITGDEAPDMIAVSGQIEFRYNSDGGDYVIAAEAEGGPTIMTVSPVIVELNPDGNIEYNGLPYVALFAPDSHTNPSTGSYKVTFQNLRYGGTSINILPFNIPAVPDGEIDLARVARVPGTIARPVQVGPPGVSVSSLRLTQDDNLIFTLSDGKDLPPINLDGISDVAGLVSDAYDAADDADVARGAAKASADLAFLKADESRQWAELANGHSNNAKVQADAALAQAGTAGSEATKAAGSATSAADQVGLAKAQVTLATTQAGNASGSATAANTAKTAAETAKTAAETARTQAQTAKTDAETARTAAQGFSTTAGTKAGEAAASAVTAKTEADRAANYVGGVKDGTVTNVSVAANANIERTKILGLQAALDSKPTLWNGELAALNIHMSPESAQSVTIPYFTNDIAYNNNRGGATRLYVDGVQTTAYNLNLLFEPSAQAISVPITGVNQIVVEVDLCRSFGYGTKMGIAANEAWRARNVKFEVFEEATWKTILDAQDLASAEVVKQYGAAQSGTSKIRITFTGFQGSGFRLAQVYMLSYASDLGAGPFLPRGGGAVFGAIEGYPPTAPAHLTRKDYVDNAVSGMVKTTGDQNLANNLGVGGNLTTSGHNAARGAYGESTSTPGAYTGVLSSTPRVMLANGTPAQNWQIDNQAGVLRFFMPGSVQLALSNNSIDVMNKPIKNVTNPTAAQDASTKKYTDDAVATREAAITAGTTAQYFRGDKTWATLDKASVSLGNVDNTADVSKPISTAVANALSGKAASGHTHTKADIGLGNVDNTADASKPVSTAQASAISGRVANASGQSNTLWTGTQAEYDALATATKQAVGFVAVIR